MVNRLRFVGIGVLMGLCFALSQPVRADLGHHEVVPQLEEPTLEELLRPVASLTSVTAIWEEAGVEEVTPLSLDWFREIAQEHVRGFVGQTVIMGELFSRGDALCASGLVLSSDREVGRVRICAYQFGGGRQEFSLAGIKFKEEPNALTQRLAGDFLDSVFDIVDVVPLEPLPKK